MDRRLAASPAVAPPAVKLTHYPEVVVDRGWQDGAVRVEGWVREGNVSAFAELVAAALAYPWDDGDAAALAHGLAGTDLEGDRWFTYPIVVGDLAEPVAVLGLANPIGDVVVVRGDLADPDERMVGRVEALIDVCASRSLA